MGENQAAAHRQQTSASPAARASTSAPSAPFRTRAFCWTPSTSSSDSENNQKYKVYAVVAPSISSQFVYAKLGQVITGLKAAGLLQRRGGGAGRGHGRLPRGQGAGREGLPHQLSCCPAFVSYIEKSFPTLQALRQPQPLPHGRGGALHQGHRPRRQNHLHRPLHGQEAGVPAARRSRPWIDCVLTFEELQALV